MLRILKHLPRILRDIFLYNFYKRFRNCDFPVSILPKLNYVSLIDIQSLLDKQTVYIIRRSDKSSEDTFNELGKLRDDALQPREIPFLSLNLLGGYFKPEDSKFKILKKGIVRWEGREFISIIDFLHDYEKLNNYCLIYIEANGVNGQIIPYRQPSYKDLDIEVEKFFKHVDKPKITNGSYEFKAVSNIVHDPVILNYWHMELRLLNYQDSPIEYKSSAWLKALCNQVISNIISANSFKEIPNYQEIPREFFQKSILSF